MMEIQVIEKTTITKWLIDDKYGFEMSIPELNHLCWRIQDEFGIVDAWDIPEDNHVKFFIENQILEFDEGHFTAGKKFNEFYELIKSEL